jgi:hypothetical protein
MWGGLLRHFCPLSLSIYIYRRLASLLVGTVVSPSYLHHHQLSTDHIEHLNRLCISSHHQLVGRHGTGKEATQGDEAAEGAQGAEGPGSTSSADASSCSSAGVTNFFKAGLNEGAILVCFSFFLNLSHLACRHGDGCI